MDIIVLGLLMIKRSTLYELRKVIEANFTMISSSSLGSIQAALRKLLDKGCISCTEFVENGVCKKEYAITEAGRAAFLESLAIPMRYKEKNMELGKLFFLGFLEKEERLRQIEVYLEELRGQLAMLEVLAGTLEPRYSTGEEELRALRAEGADRALTMERAKDIAMYQYATLDLGIAQLRFEIEWFEGFKVKMKGGE